MLYFSSSDEGKKIGTKERLQNEERKNRGVLTTGISSEGFGTTILKDISFVNQHTDMTYPPTLKLSLSRKAIAGNLFCMPCQGTSCGGVNAGTGGPRLSEVAIVVEDGVA